jgi:hypothetical protein
MGPLRQADVSHCRATAQASDNNDTLVELVRTLDRIGFARQHAGWVHNLKTIREARSPQALARTYAAAIARTNTPAVGAPTRSPTASGSSNTTATSQMTDESLQDILANMARPQ